MNEDPPPSRAPQICRRPSSSPPAAPRAFLRAGSLSATAATPRLGGRAPPRQAAPARAPALPRLRAAEKTPSRRRASLARPLTFSVEK